MNLTHQHLPDFNTEEDEISQVGDQPLRNKSVADTNNWHIEPSLSRQSYVTVTDVQETNERSEDSHGSGSTVTEGQIQMPQREFGRQIPTDVDAKALPP